MIDLGIVVQVAVTIVSVGVSYGVLTVKVTRLCQDVRNNQMERRKIWENISKHDHRVTVLETKCEHNHG